MQMLKYVYISLRNMIETHNNIKAVYIFKFPLNQK